MASTRSLGITINPRTVEKVRGVGEAGWSSPPLPAKHGNTWAPQTTIKVATAGCYRCMQYSMVTTSTACPKGGTQRARRNTIQNVKSPSEYPGVGNKSMIDMGEFAVPVGSPTCSPASQPCLQAAPFPAAFRQVDGRHPVGAREGLLPRSLLSGPVAAWLAQPVAASVQMTSAAPEWTLGGGRLGRTG
jgi:hypothetical protein